jgi:quinol monooxygenase YgiN
MIIIEATLDFADRAARDDAVAATAAIQLATRVEEPGCRTYCFAADPADDTRIQVYELWDDEASVLAHFRHPNYHSMRATLQSFGLVAAANRMFLVARDEPVYGPGGQIRDRLFVDPEPDEANTA